MIRFILWCNFHMAWTHCCAKRLLYNKWVLQQKADTMKLYQGNVWPMPALDNEMNILLIITSASRIPTCYSKQGCGNAWCKIWSHNMHIGSVWIRKRKQDMKSMPIGAEFDGTILCLQKVSYIKWYLVLRRKFPSFRYQMFHAQMTCPGKECMHCMNKKTIVKILVHPCCTICWHALCWQLACDICFIVTSMIGQFMITTLLAVGGNVSVKIV